MASRRGTWSRTPSPPFYVHAVREALARDEEGYLAELARYQERLFAAGLTRVYDAAVCH